MENVLTQTEQELNEGLYLITLEDRLETIQAAAADPYCCAGDTFEAEAA